MWTKLSTIRLSRALGVRTSQRQLFLHPRVRHSTFTASTGGRQEGASLGGGRELTKDTVPFTPDFTERVPERRSKPVVIGDRIFVWEDDQTEIYVGFERNKVCSKWFWRMGL